MLFEHTLRVRLRERRNRLHKADYQVFENELKFFVGWLDSEPYLRALIAEIEAEDITLEEWKSTGGFGWQQLEFPDSEAKRAKVCLALCREGDATRTARSITDSSRFDDMVQQFADTFVDPLVNFLEDRIDEGSAILGILHRYKRHAEWFRRRELFDLYEADTRHGEDVLDANLREYLLDQGVPFPFSQPGSPSGKADVVSGLETDDPLALEIKLFLPEAGKDDAYVRQGFAQAFRYANDYGLAAGYLVTFNLTPELLIFESTSPGVWPPSVQVGEKTIFLISIDVHPEMPKASKDRELARHEISQEFLLKGL